MQRTDTGGEPSSRISTRLLAGGVALFLLLLVVGEFLIRRDATGAERQHELRVQSDAATVRATLEGELNQTLFLAVGLRGYVEADPTLGTPDQIERLLSAVYDQGTHLRNIGLAPDNQITHVYPLEGNEAAIGVRYEELPGQWEDVERAMDSGTTVLAGPVELVQGGIGLVNRTPVFLPGGEYWGIISLVVDLDSLFTEVRERNAGATVRWALRTTAEGSPGIPVTGDQVLFDEAESIRPVAVAEGTWELAVVSDGTPTPGAVPSNVFRVGLVVVAGLLSTLLVLVVRERELVREQALQDPLTRLPNRRHLEEQLENLIAGSRRTDDTFSLVFVDLDGFKVINDRHGHAAGDAVLTELGHRLVDAVRATDVVARVGGDEFIVLLPGLGGADDARVVVAKIVDALARPIDHGGTRLSVGASVGVGRFPAHAASASELISVVDGAMYEVKRTDGSAVRVRFLDDAPTLDLTGPGAPHTAAGSGR